jgi:type II secretory pathway pseudopilin PulG
MRKKIKHISSETIVIILASLLLIAVATGMALKKQQQLKNDNKKRAAVIEIQKGLENYFQNEGQYPDNLNDLVPDYLKSLPNQVNSIPFEYLFSGNHSTYKLRVGLENARSDDEHVTEENGTQYYQVEAKY